MGVFAPANVREAVFMWAELGVGRAGEGNKECGRWLWHAVSVAQANWVQARETSQPAHEHLVARPSKGTRMAGRSPV